MESLPIISDEFGRDAKGRFAVGNTGKPKGAINKTTKDLKQFITNFLNEKAFEIPLIWDTLEDKDKATLFLHLAKLVMPKNQSESENEENFKPVTVEIVLPDGRTLDDVMNELKPE
ncbi:MAG: hypothetical protein RL264_2487 [Bacteroidota bacterium]|jgi:hypothetical protein